MNTARLLFPAIRWSAESGFDEQERLIEAALAAGVGGFIIFGGEADAVRTLTTRLQASSREPLLIGADLERGAGQQFEGATALPPLAAFGWLDDLEVTRRAAELTAREARAIGVNWIYGPVADLANEPRNPIVGTRALGRDPARVGEHVAAWVAGCHEGGALACAKHFPGHGRTTTDSHAELPRVDAMRAALDEDLIPFRRAIEAGVDAVMTAHVVYSELDPRAPATLSAKVVRDLLRTELGFRGIVVTDGLMMEGVLIAGGGAAGATSGAVLAGCDALLYPDDLQHAAATLRDALADGRLSEARIVESVSRIDAASGAIRPAPAASWGTDADRAWAADIARRVVYVVRGEPKLPPGPFDVVTVDDDLGGPYPAPSRATLLDTFRSAGVRDDEGSERGMLIAVYSDIRAWKSRPGLSPSAIQAVRDALEARPRSPVVLFGHPRLAEDLPGRNVVCAWGGEPVMQRAAAEWLLEHEDA